MELSITIEGMSASAMVTAKREDWLVIGKNGKPQLDQLKELAIRHIDDVAAQCASAPHSEEVE